MKKLDESSILWLKKYAGTLTESEHRDFISKIEKSGFNLSTVQIRNIRAASGAGATNTIEFDLNDGTKHLHGTLIIDEGNMSFELGDIGYLRAYSISPSLEMFKTDYTITDVRVKDNNIIGESQMKDLFSIVMKELSLRKDIKHDDGPYY